MCAAKCLPQLLHNTRIKIESNMNSDVDFSKFHESEEKHHSTVNFHHIVVSPDFRSHYTREKKHRSHCAKLKYQTTNPNEETAFFHHYLIRRSRRPGKREEIDWSTCKINLCTIWAHLFLSAVIYCSSCNVKFLHFKRSKWCKCENRP